MDPEEEKRIAEEIMKNRRLSFSIELLDVDGDKITVRNTFGSTIIYVRKGDNYYLEENL